MTSKTYESVTPHKVAFLGLGVMGAPMARHLLAAGHQVTVFNRTASKAQDWLKQNAREGDQAARAKAAATPREAA
jgi:3-hydroxyisobutyrate dehydrogenase-like beta-hydroxyacid dehydrogenase